MREGQQARAADEHRQLIPLPGRVEKAPCVEEMNRWTKAAGVPGAEPWQQKDPPEVHRSPRSSLVQALMSTFVRNLPHAEEAAARKEQKEQ